MTDSVVRGQPDTRTGRYHLDGVLTDPTLPLITIRDSLGVAFIANATPTRISAGIYNFDWTAPLDGALGNWTAEWTGVLSGFSVGPIIETFEMLPVGSITPTPNGSYTYDLDTAVGQLRLLTQDHDLSSVSAVLPLEQRSAAFTDEELTFFLSQAHGDLGPAAAITLRAWANSKQLIVIARRTGRTSFEYGDIRKDLMAAAKEFDRVAQEAPADGIAEQVWTDFSLRQILTNEALRDDA